MYRFLALMLLTFASPASAAENGAMLSHRFEAEVTMRLALPAAEQAVYGQHLLDALTRAGVHPDASQYIVLMDRSPQVQAVFIYWLEKQEPGLQPHFIGASPASTGKPGEYDYFITPLGAFPNTVDAADYRAEGTQNKLGIRGLGRKGLRVFDFGWVQGKRGWDNDGYSPMRLLLHATDPDWLEPHLGEPMSKGCIRIPAALVDFIDRYGLLDADYERSMMAGKEHWQIRKDRTPTPWSGRYLVIIDSGQTERPEWSPKPVHVHPKDPAAQHGKPPAADTPPLHR